MLLCYPANSVLLLCGTGTCKQGLAICGSPYCAHNSSWTVRNSNHLFQMWVMQHEHQHAVQPVHSKQERNSQLTTKVWVLMWWIKPFKRLYDRKKDLEPHKMDDYNIMWCNWRCKPFDLATENARNVWWVWKRSCGNALVPLSNTTVINPELLSYYHISVQ